MHNRYLYPDDPEYPANRRLWLRDPIDGARVLRNVSRDRFETWCNENCQGKYWVGMGFIDFELINDYYFAILSLESAVIR
jgi:hypothetical protein